MGLNPQRNSDESKNDTGEGDSITLMEFNLIGGSVSSFSLCFFHFFADIDNRHLPIFDFFFYSGEGFSQFELEIISVKFYFLKNVGLRFKSMDIAVPEPEYDFLGFGTINDKTFLGKNRIGFPLFSF